MKRLYFLIRNTSGCTYWSYRIARNDKNFKKQFLLYQQMVLKYGTIYVNRNGGWFPADAVESIHGQLVQETFPDDPE